MICYLRSISTPMTNRQKPTRTIADAIPPTVTTPKTPDRSRPRQNGLRLLPAAIGLHVPRYSALKPTAPHRTTAKLYYAQRADSKQLRNQLHPRRLFQAVQQFAIVRGRVVLSSNFFSSEGFVEKRLVFRDKIRSARVGAKHR